MFLGQEKVSVS